MKTINLIPKSLIMVLAIAGCNRGSSELQNVPAETNPLDTRVERTEKNTTVMTDSERQYRCDTFIVRAELKGDALSIGLETDLPDVTKISVNVDRLFKKKGDSEDYSIEYYQRFDTVRKWREKHQLDLPVSDGERSRRKWITEYRTQGVELDFISDKLRVTIAVIMNQDDPRLNRLTGKAVKIPSWGHAAVEDVVWIDYPLNADSEESSEKSSTRKEVLGDPYNPDTAYLDIRELLPALTIDQALELDEAIGQLETDPTTLKMPNEFGHFNTVTAISKYELAITQLVKSGSEIRPLLQKRQKGATNTFVRARFDVVIEALGGTSPYSPDTVRLLFGAFSTALTAEELRLVGSRIEKRGAPSTLLLLMQFKDACKSRTDRVPTYMNILRGCGPSVATQLVELAPTLGAFRCGALEITADIGNAATIPLLERLESTYSYDQQMLETVKSAISRLRKKALTD